MNQTITLPRSVVEQALDALEDNIEYDFHGNPYEVGDELMQVAAAKLQAALDQPQRKLTAQDIADSSLLGNIESPLNACMHQEHCKRWKAEANQQHQHESRHINDLATKTSHSVTACSTVPEGWKLVPVEPTREMENACMWATQREDIWVAMLAAAPQPPTVKESLTVEQPQVERGPALVVGYDKQGWRQMLDDMREIPDGTPLYTHPQPKREQLTDEQVAAATGAKPGTPMWLVAVAFTRAIEAAHGIGGEV